MESGNNIFEIFNAVNGETQGYRFGEVRARQTVARCDNVNVPGFVADWLPAKDGFFIVDIRDNVKDGPFGDCRTAQAKADFENQGSDTNSFRVYQQVI